MATFTSCLFEVRYRPISKISIVNQLRVDGKNVDKVFLIFLEDSSRIILHDPYDERIKSILTDGEPEYYSCLVHFIGINRSVYRISVYGRHGELFDNEARSYALLIAEYILCYKTLPAILGKRKRNGGLSKDEEEEEGDLCSICYDEYQTDQMIGTLECKHSYHEGCIKNWFSRKKQCPICRHVSKFPFLSRPCSDADKEPHVQYTNSEAKHKSETKASKAKRRCSDTGMFNKKRKSSNILRRRKRVKRTKQG